MSKKNAIVGQSGGPTAAINATLAGVIEGAINSSEINVLYGAFNGIEGMLDERMCNLSEKFADEYSRRLLAQTPAAALGSCRKKLPALDSDGADEFYNNVFSLFAKYDIGFFFYIGGNDSMDTVNKLTQYGKKIGSDVVCIGVPKTIDNDLVCTDHTPGFGSAAKYIATTMQEILRDTAVYTVKAVTIVEIMGRDAGWLTASAALTGRIAGIAPDLVYLPEVPFEYDRFFADLEKCFEKHPNVVVAVSEGIAFADGRLVGEGAQSGATDTFGHKYLSGTGKALELAVKEKFGCKARSVELNLPQRCAAHIASATDISESVAIGKASVGTGTEIYSYAGCVMTAKRTDDPYTITFEPECVAKIANNTKFVPAEYINEDGNGITEAGIDYLYPLIQGELDVIFENGLPKHVEIK